MLLVAADSMVCGRAVAAWVLQTAQVCHWHSSVPLLSFMYLSRIVRETKLRVFPNPVNWRRMVLACMALAQTCIERKALRAILSKRSPKRMALGLALGAGIDDDESVFKRSPGSLVGLAPQRTDRLSSGIAAGGTLSIPAQPTMSVTRRRPGAGATAAGAAGPASGRAADASGSILTVASSDGEAHSGGPSQAGGGVPPSGAAAGNTAITPDRVSDDQLSQPSEDLPALEEEEEEEEEDMVATSSSEVSKSGGDVTNRSSPRPLIMGRVLPVVEMPSSMVDPTSPSPMNRRAVRGGALTDASGAGFGSEISELSSRAASEADSVSGVAAGFTADLDEANDPVLASQQRTSATDAASDAVTVAAEVSEAGSLAPGSRTLRLSTASSTVGDEMAPPTDAAAAPTTGHLDLTHASAPGAAAAAASASRRPVYPKSNAGASAEGALLADLLKQVALLLKFRVAVSMRLLARFRGEFRGMMERNEQELAAALLPITASSGPKRKAPSPASDAGMLAPGQVADSSDDDDDSGMDLPRIDPQTLRRVQISEFGAVQQKLILDGTTRSQAALMKRQKRELHKRRERRRAQGLHTSEADDHSAASAASASGAGLSDASFSQFSASTLASSAWLPLLESSFAEQASDQPPPR
jgi:hypothetical protein